MVKNNLFILCLLFAFRLNANITLPNLVGSNMVLQQNHILTIWGYGSPKEKVQVRFLNKVFNCITNAKGKWEINIGKYKFGGPYNMLIKGSNTITITNILIGEVWVCSGQSNMEWPLWAVNNAELEIKNATYNSIRLFNIPHNMCNSPLDTTSGLWLSCEPLTAKYFSAVGYFFARKLNTETNIPIGIIAATWGGTMAECWLPNYMANTLVITKQKAKLLDTFSVLNASKNAAYNNEIWLKQLNNKDTGLINNTYVFTKQFNGNWDSISLPKYWDNEPNQLKDADGIVYFQKQFFLNSKDLLDSIFLNLTAIDDADITFVNNQQVGATTEAWSTQRHYYIPTNYLHVGINYITVRVSDYIMGGGFNGKATEMYIKTKNNKLDISGFWKFKIGYKAKFTSFPAKIFSPNAMPSLLYNGMIAPLKKTAFKGVIWYQGESNASDAKNYKTLFINLIASWRKDLKKDSLPFYFVQLANYFEANKYPSTSTWAEIRAAQNYALLLPNTAMATAIDIGDANTIHPKNKQDVGLRLANLALKNIYNINNIKPFNAKLKNIIRLNDTVYIAYFENVYNGLQLKDTTKNINGFEVNYSNGQNKYIKATIVTTNKIKLYVDGNSTILAIKYAWANNPGFLNVYNSEALPLLPFEYKFETTEK